MRSAQACISGGNDRFPRCWSVRAVRVGLNGASATCAQKWTSDDVATWLVEQDFDDLVDLLCRQHKIDGRALLELNEQDLRLPPLQMPVLGEMKRLWIALLRLRKENAAAAVVSEHQFPVRAFSHFEEFSADLLIAEIESTDTRNKSILKTIIAGLYFAVAILITSLVMVIVHDRVPDSKTFPPLPDIFLDNIPFIPWAFDVCEILACFLGLVWTLVVVFHKHRLVLLRRFFSLVGTVFMLRCITIMITSLSVPGVHLDCQARYSDWSTKLYRACQIWYGLGMSLFNVRSCGDYMFSGHTTVVTMFNHFITEYTPDSWNYLHTTSWVCNLFAIFFILAAHEHYSLDVFVAFYISSRLFLYYHSLAYHAQAISSADSRTRIWFPLFWFFESGGQVGRVPNEYEWPLPSVSTLCSYVNGQALVRSCKEELTKLRSVYRIHFHRIQHFFLDRGGGQRISTIQEDRSKNE
uniref:SAM domain-containing protein n=1 Tax=Trichuris muris TaxID=70415 RepID=A0A5S6QZC5_TRIMR